MAFNRIKILIVACPCYNRGMITYFDKVRKIPSRFHYVWASLAFLAWAGRQWWQWKQNDFFSLIIFLKGLLLLGLVAAAYGLACRLRPGFIFLGFFPSLWLAVSRAQWDICSQTDGRYWIWTAVFLLGELFLLALTDGRKLLAAVGLLWITLAVIFPVSFLNFLSFGWIRNGSYFKKAEWSRYGFPLLGFAAWVLLKGWSSFHFLWYDVYEVLISDYFISFFFLGWLGALSFSTKKRPWLPAFGPLFLMPLGMMLLSGADPFSLFRQEDLKWILIFFAGFGLESFRRDMMDRSWHGRLLWFVLGFCFFGGVL